MLLEELTQAPEIYIKFQRTNKYKITISVILNSSANFKVLSLTYSMETFFSEFSVTEKFVEIFLVEYLVSFLNVGYKEAF